MSYRDEDDIFEEDVVFDQAGLLSSARKRGKSAIRRVSSGRCAMLSKTLALCGAFFGLGLAYALPGPATPVPPSDFTDDETSGKEHIYRCLGFMLGSMLGFMLLDRFNRLFLVFLALLMCAVLVAMVPWTGITWLLRSDLILLGATMGFLLTGGNVLCLDLWAQNSRPFMQALHFSFSLGAFLAPLIARPLNPMVATVTPATVHSRFPRAVNAVDLVLPEMLRNKTFTSVSAFSTPINDSTVPLLALADVTMRTDTKNSSSYQTTMKPLGSFVSTSNIGPLFSASLNSSSNQTSSPVLRSSNDSGNLANATSSSIHTGQAHSTVSMSSIYSQVSGSSANSPVSTASTNLPVSTSSISSSVSTSSTSSPGPTGNTNSPVSSSTVSLSISPSSLHLSTLASSGPSLISSGSTNSSKPAENASIPISTSSTDSTSSHLSHHKYKPPVNSGNKLDKSVDWDKVPVGKPPPEDVNPAAVANAQTSTTMSTIVSTATSILSSKLIRNENITASTPTSIVLPTPQKVSEKPGNLPDNDTVAGSVPPSLQEVFEKPGNPPKRDSVTSTVPPSLQKVFEKPGNLSEGDSVTKVEHNLSGVNESGLGKVTKQILPVLKSPAPIKVPQNATSEMNISLATKHPNVVKILSSVTAAPSTTTTTPSPPSSPSEPLPKSLTLTENSPTFRPQAAPKPFPSAVSSSSATPTPIPSPESPANETHVETTPAPPHRHRSKPASYDNDTEEFHTVMDEVADRAKQYGLSRLQLSYLLVAILLLVASLLFLGFLCFNPRDPRSRSEEDVGGGRSNVVRPRWLRILLTSLMMLVLCLSAGIQYSYGHLLVMFAMHSPLSLSYSTASALTATFWGTVTSTRLACILLASALSPGALLVFSVVLTSVATWLVVALAAQSAAALWVGAVLVAVGTASILPSSFLWMQQHIHISHHVAGMLVMGPAMGEMLFPQLSERIMMGVGPAGLLHLSGLLSLAVIALWASAWRVARHPCTSLCNRADPAEHSYQLASQTDEDDHLDLTMSPLTHRGHSNSAVARRSSHANGNGIHRTGT